MLKVYKVKQSIIGPLYFYRNSLLMGLPDPNDISKSLRLTNEHNIYPLYFRDETIYYEYFSRYQAALTTKNMSHEWSDSTKHVNDIVLTFMQTTWSIDVGSLNIYNSSYKVITREFKSCFRCVYNEFIISIFFF